MGSPYFLYGYQRPWRMHWTAGPGGIPAPAGSGVYDGLGSLGADTLRTDLSFPVFQRGVGDFPAQRPSGPEPLDPGMLGYGRPRGLRELRRMGLAAFDVEGGVSQILLYGALGVGALWLWDRWKPRKNPSQRRRRR